MRAGEVGAQHGVPIFQFHAQRESVASDRGVVHQDIELAEFRENLLKAGFDLHGVGDVHGDCERFAACGFNLGDQRCEFFGVAGGDCDLCAGGSEGERRRAADSLRRAGDECGFTS